MKTFEIRLALLRGINLAGRNRLSMKDLKDLFSTAQCVNVRTFIQSGNVIFESPAGLAAKLPSVLSAAIAKRFDLQIPVILRTAPEMESAVAGNPSRGSRKKRFR